MWQKLNYKVSPKAREHFRWKFNFSDEIWVEVFLIQIFYLNIFKPHDFLCIS